MRIGITTHNYPPHLGGLETVVRELARGFARVGHEVIVVTTAWEGRMGVAIEDNVTVHRLPAWHGSEARGVPYAAPFGPGVPRAFAALRRCDVLHAHGSLYLTTLLALAARRRGVQLFVTEHVGFVPYSSKLVNLVQRAAWLLVGRPVVRRSAKVVAMNSRVHDWLRSRFGDKAVFIANGVDTATFSPRSGPDRRAARVRLGLPPDSVLALFVGRAAQKKNLEALLRFPRTGFRLVVCGAKRSLGGDVIDLGTLPHETMPDLFAAADFLLHPATGEGFPVAIQEAMASGLPVAVLWDSGYAGSIDRGVVTAADSLDELAHAADGLAASPDRRKDFGRRARAFAVQFWSWDAAVTRYLDLFRSTAAASA